MSEYTGFGLEGGGLQLSGPLSASWSYSLARFGRHRRVILRFVGHDRKYLFCVVWRFFTWLLHMFVSALFRPRRLLHARCLVRLSAAFIAFTACGWSCPVVRFHVRFPVSLQLGVFPSAFAVRCFSIGLAIFLWSVVPMVQLSWRLRCLRHVRFSLLMSQASLKLRFC